MRIESKVIYKVNIIRDPIFKRFDASKVTVNRHVFSVLCDDLNTVIAVNQIELMR